MNLRVLRVIWLCKKYNVIKTDALLTWHKMSVLGKLKGQLQNLFPCVSIHVKKNKNNSHQNIITSHLVLLNVNDLCVLNSAMAGLSSFFFLVLFFFFELNR